MVLNLANDIRFGVLDILRGIGIGIVNVIFSTIDTLYDVAQKINSLNFINMLENMPNSPFTKIFNAFFMLSFILLLLFSVWKISFRILDADNNEQPLFELVKEIVKCGFLIFSIYLIFNTSVNIGINLSNAIYNNFSNNKSTIGDKMKSAYLTVNDSCYKVADGDKVDKTNVSELKNMLNGFADTSSANTMSDFETLIRNDTITATNIIDAGAFSYRCTLYKPGLWNDGEDYAFEYNFVFGIVIGVIFLFSIGFAVLMLGRRQLELVFLMSISPLVIATSVGRKEQRSALYQQLASLVLQAGAMMLLIGLTITLFNVIQNSTDINSMDYFTKIVAQSVLYLGCAMLLMTGCTSLNRFIGENVSANSGRDMMLAMKGLTGGIAAAGSMGVGALVGAVKTGVGTYKVGKGIGQIGKGVAQVGNGFYHGISSFNDKMNQSLSKKMNTELGRGTSQVVKGQSLQQSSSDFLARTYGKMLEARGEKTIENVGNKWDFENDRYNANYMSSGVEQIQNGWSNIKSGFGLDKKDKNKSNSNANKKSDLMDYVDDTTE